MAEYEMGVTGQSFFSLCLWAGKPLMLDPSLPPERLVSTFTEGYYGPAATAMRRYYRVLEKALLEESESMDSSHHPSRRSYLTVDFLSGCRAVLLEAEAATAPDSKERVHVWQEMIVVYTCILNQWDRMKRQNGRAFPFSRRESLDKYASSPLALRTEF